MLTQKQKDLKREIEKEMREIEVLIQESKERGYSFSVVGLLISSKIVKRDRLRDIERYE